MKIVVAVRCLNEEKNIERFLKGYSFADLIVVSDGGSTDRSLELLQNRTGVELINFTGGETVNGQFWNTDAPHMNFVIDQAKGHNPDWIIFDDMDCVPNRKLREGAREYMETCDIPQMNVFRLYMWGDDEYFPHMNRDFDENYTSLWAWKPQEVDIKADINVKHGTLLGLAKSPRVILPPAVLLHKSWHPDTVEAKMQRYKAIGLEMNHPLNFAGAPKKLPDYAKEE